MQACHACSWLFKSATLLLLLQLPLLEAGWSFGSYFRRLPKFKRPETPVTLHRVEAPKQGTFEPSLKQISKDVKPHTRLLLTNPWVWPEYVRGPGRYQWVLSDAGLRSGQVYAGHNTRLRAAMQRLANGEKLRVVAVGGSVTLGNCIKGEGKAWPQWLHEYLQDNWGPNVEVLNAAVSATKSNYLNACPDKRIPKDADVVMIEYSFNDKSATDSPVVMARSFERLLRKVLQWYPNYPAIVLVHTLSWEDVGSNNWNSTLETEYNDLAVYYQLPVISLRACCFDILQEGKAKGFSTAPIKYIVNNTAHYNESRYKESFFMDSRHLDGYTGSRVLAELAMKLFNDTRNHVAYQPLSLTELSVMKAPPPEPFFPGNHGSGSSQCFLGKSFLTRVKASKGFEWINERPDQKMGKWGMISTEPGSYLTMEVDSRGSTQQDTASPVLLLMGYLKSYEHMGAASLECTSGCKCPTTVIDAHSKDRRSLMNFHKIPVSQHQNCQLRLTVLNMTASGEHKFKALGVVVSEDTGDLRDTSRLGLFLTEDKTTVRHAGFMVTDSKRRLKSSSSSHNRRMSSQPSP